MSGFKNKLESIFAATAFAEMNDHKTAVEISGVETGIWKKLASLKEQIEKIFAATAFTDIGCFDMAVEITRTPIVQDVKEKSFANFLEDIGLSGVQFHYLVARIQ